MHANLDPCGNRAGNVSLLDVDLAEGFVGELGEGVGAHVKVDGIAAGSVCDLEGCEFVTW